MTDISKMTEKDLCFMFDHTNLKAYASSEDIRKLCAEAKEYGFRMVAINPVHTAMCREILSGTDVHVGPCVSFPLGQNTIEEKCTETLLAISQGADEIDYVTNLTAVKDGRWDYIEREMRTIADICRSAGVISKVIFENCYLEKQEIEHLAKIALIAKPDFIKTSTGFGTGGATVEDVALMKQTVGDAVQVKAAGGIRSWETCKAMIEAGAARIGCSAGIQILKEFGPRVSQQRIQSLQFLPVVIPGADKGAASVVEGMVSIITPCYNGERYIAEIRRYLGIGE